MIQAGTSLTRADVDQLVQQHREHFSGKPGRTRLAPAGLPPLLIITDSEGLTWIQLERE
jgi:hypothetical protein